MKNSKADIKKTEPLISVQTIPSILFLQHWPPLRKPYVACNFSINPFNASSEPKAMEISPD